MPDLRDYWYPGYVHGYGEITAAQSAAEAKRARSINEIIERLTEKGQLNADKLVEPPVLGISGQAALISPELYAEMIREMEKMIEDDFFPPPCRCEMCVERRAME